MYLVVGLGNPGRKYLKNLHNLGFMAVELCAERKGVAFNRKGFKAVYGEYGRGEGKVIFLKPQTFMNLSGESVAEAVGFFKIPPCNVLVVYDDLDIAIGAMRMRRSGSAGTHNGMRSVVASLGTTEFPRIRIGTKPEGEYDIINYVLSDVKKEDEPRFKISVNAAADAIEQFIAGEDVEKIMCMHNGG